MARQVAPGIRTPIHTSLPATPLDGQEIRYLADATNGVIWTLRYRAASASPYKWEMVGGSMLMATSAGGTGYTSGTYQTTGTPSVVMPLAGDYEMDIGGFFQGSSPSINLDMALHDDGVITALLAFFVGIDTYEAASVWSSRVLAGVGAESIMNLRHHTSNPGLSYGCTQMVVKARPVRVG